MIQVLVVDDEKAICDILRSTFEFIDIKTLTALSGHEAIEIAKKEKPQAVFIDYFLPDINGIELMKQIKNLYNGSLFFFVSAAKEPQIESDAIEQGAARFIHKPFDRQQIRACLTDHLNVMIQAKRQPRILIVDDDINIVTSLSRFLNRHLQAEIKSEMNGTNAFNLMKHEHFDLILLDIKLPGKDGLQIVRELPDLIQKSYIIAITGHTGYEIVTEAQKLGIQDLVHKPYNPEELMSKIKSVLVAKNIYMEKK